MLRKARIDDVKHMHSIINASASSGEMLPRSLSELYDNIRDFFVYEEKGKIVGTCALHVCWENLAEIRSVCVRKALRMRGIGRLLVGACIGEAEEFGISNIFLLTYRDKFFSRFGFSEIDKKDLPQKIWSDCIKCPKFPECDEIAMTLKIEKNKR